MAGDRPVRTADCPFVDADPQAWRHGSRTLRIVYRNVTDANATVAKGEGEGLIFYTVV